MYDIVVAKIGFINPTTKIRFGTLMKAIHDPKVKQGFMESVQGQFATVSEDKVCSIQCVKVESGALIVGIDPLPTEGGDKLKKFLNKGCELKIDLTLC